MMKKKKQRKLDSTLAALHHLLLTLLFRRRRFYYQLFPLLSALSGCVLLCFVATSLLHSSPSDHRGHLRSDLHRSKNHGVDSSSDSSLDTSDSGKLEGDLWSIRGSTMFYGCSNATNKFSSAVRRTHPNRYLLIATSGGLNQQRTGITDAVVAAYILNATLVVPNLDQKSFWKDNSKFEEIFDVEWFISSLLKDVRIIKQLPLKGGKALSPYKMRVPRKCSPECYLTHVLPVLNKKHVVQLGKFDYRLSNRLDTDLQKLRCRVNYHALRYTDPINEFGKKLVERMRMRSKHFIALHLRFEPDMLAFSGCYYGGGEKERSELGEIRKRWKSLHTSNPEKVRRHGRCPLTPEEVGLMLRALGYSSETQIYVASGEIYGGEETLKPLKALFPNFHSKESISTPEELAPFSSFSSRLAALDFIVCDQSDVFATNNNGNMAKILAGRRRYYGHKPTIRPNGKKLYRLFKERSNMTWESFAFNVRTKQIGFLGEPSERSGEFHENPSSCICQISEETPFSVNQTNKIHQEGEEQFVEDDSFDKEDDSFDKEDDSDVLVGPEKPEVEEFFSD